MCKKHLKYNNNVSLKNKKQVNTIKFNIKMEYTLLKLQKIKL